MSSFHDKVLKVTAFRDLTHSKLVSGDKKELLSRVWKDYADYRFGPAAESEELLNTGIQTVWISRDANPVRQALQYSLYLKPYHGDGGPNDDTRVWDVFSSFKFSPSQVIIPFFTNGSRSTKNSSKSSKLSDAIGPVWNTFPSSNFEKVLYLVFVIRASQPKYFHSSTISLLGKRKRTHGILKTKLSSQKLAFAIQRVTRAWNRVADSFAFHDVEKMLLPYFIPSPEFDDFIVLQSRNDGYAPVDLERTFAERVSSTCSPEHVSAHAFGYTDDVDQIFRQLAGYFINDLRNVAKDTTFFEEDATPWSFGDIFPSSGPIKRFYDITGTLEALQTAIGTEHDLSFVMNDSRDVSFPSELVGKTEAGLSSNLRISGVCGDKCACFEARKRLERFMTPFFRFHLTSFESLVETDDALKPLSEVGIPGNVQLILTDPPYLSHNDPGNINLNYDVLLHDEMKEAVDVFKTLLRPGGHLFVFCTSQQYGKWSQLLSHCKQGSERHGETDGPAFVVDKNPFLCIKKPGVSAETNSQKGIDVASLESASDLLIHARRLGYSTQKPEEMIRLKRFGHVPSRHSARTNVIDNVPRLEPREALWVTREDGKGREMLRTDQKSVCLSREIISRYTFEGETVADPFSGTCSTAVACATIPNERMRKFVGCELDETVYIPALHRVQNEFASLLLDEKSRKMLLPSLEVTADVLRVAEVINEHSTRAGKRTNNWSAPKGLPKVSILPDHIVHHVALLWREIGRLSSMFRKPFHEWPHDLQVKMETVDYQPLLAVECAKLGLFVERSSVQHKSAGLGLYANRNFSKGDFVAPYYGRLIYHDMSNRSDIKRHYGHGFAACNTLDFLHYSIELNVSKESEFYALLPKDNGTKSQPVGSVYLVPFKFTAASLINDPRYALGDAQKHHEGTRRSSNVLFSQKVPSCLLKRSSQLCETDAIQIVATRCIKKGDELFVDYGKKHVINNVLTD